MMDLNRYLTDESNYTGNCQKAVVVKSLEDVEKAMISEDFLTFQGARTGLVGACVPVKGCVLDFSQWTGESDSFKSVEKSLSMVEKGGSYKEISVRSGTTLAQLRQLIRKNYRGYTFRPDPTEENATIGGLLSTDAKGPDCYGYGSMADHIASVRIVNESGEAMWITDPAEIEKLAGSEGEKAAITECTVKIYKAPEEQYYLFLFFKEEKEAFLFQNQILARRQEEELTTLVGLDYIDKNALNVLTQFAQDHDGLALCSDIPEEAGAAVYMIFHGNEMIEEDIDEVLCMLDEDFNLPEEWAWAASEENEIQKFHALRHGIQEALNAKVQTLAREFRESSDYVGPWSVDFSVSDGEGEEEKTYQSADRLIDTVRKTMENDVNYAICSHYGNGECCVTFLPRTEEEMQWLITNMNYFANRLSEQEIFPGRGFGIGKSRAAFYADMLKKDLRSEKNRLNPGNGIE